MSAIGQTHESGRWPRLVAALRELLAQHAAHPARTVVLVPYAQLMAVARRQWAAQVPDGFAPRFETTMNWAGKSGFVPGNDDLGFDMGRDLLTARAWLQAAGLGARAELLAGRLVEAAWQLAGIAAAIVPAERQAWAVRARAAAALGAEAQALQLEAAVGRIAVEWAAASAYATDALLDRALLRDIDLLVVLEGLAPDPIAQAISKIVGDKAERLALDGDAPWGAIALYQAADPSHEAEMAAACVMRHVEAGRVPVALAAIDRVLTRRVRAMVGARGIGIRDETGWKLSTTRAAAHVMGALRACAWNAGSDAVLDWLKNVPAVAPATASALERRVRREGLREWRAVASLRSDDGAKWRALVDQADAWREPMQRARTLPAWLQAARELLQACGHWPRLESDAAGVRVLETLGLHEDMQAQWQQLPQAAHRFSLADFTGWANEALEAATFKPENPDSEQVMILPFNQLLGRDVAAVVLAGCDEVRLAPSPEPQGPWTAAQRDMLGLPSREALERERRDGWRSALRAPHCDVLWRASDDSGEPVLASSLVRSLELEGRGDFASDPRDERAVTALPVAKPLPDGAPLPLSQLSASAYEDLRRCPYRFFALRQLGLQEAAEIDTELDKRDFGNWLHKVLGTFHEALRASPEPHGPARARLLDITAEEVTRAQGLEEGEFLPFAAAWPQVRDGYLAWLEKHEASGAVFEAAEREHEMQLGPVKLVGRIDRIDRLPDGSLMVMDYKTEAEGKTAERVKTPGEDTQLPFYAALLDIGDLRAAYVNVGERGKTRDFEQKAIIEARQLLAEGILDDLGRVAGGARMPALGEGVACEFCAARGLCRRDWWT
ncbi:MAG: PD-(D/E)XK nuclease family protein [Ramlibacter sp.]|nr:PD-(D/E)XK nuclease family protein [Ramlibacter sp.]